MYSDPPLAVVSFQGLSRVPASPFDTVVFGAGLAAFAAVAFTGFAAGLVLAGLAVFGADLVGIETLLCDGEPGL